MTKKKAATLSGELTKDQKIGTLAGAVLFVINGLRGGSVKSKPIMDMSDKDAEEWPLIPLEQHLWKALNAAGIYEADKSK